MFGQDVIGGLLVKLMGSAAGALLALLRFPPHNRSEAIRRASSSIIAGMVASSVVAGKLGLGPEWESVIFSAALTSFLSWGVMGVADKVTRKKLGEE